MRIDAHQHYWQPARGDYRWLDAAVPALQPLLRDFGPDDLAPLRAAHGITRTVVVQAADSEAETDFLLGLAAKDPSIAGVVGWIDLADPSRLPVLERWAAHPKFRGVRPMLQDLPDLDWIATAPHPAMVEALIRHALVFDALVKPAHLPALLRFVDRWPALRVVIDHAAKPALRERWGRAWAQDWHAGLSALAERPQLRCKWSGLLTEASAAQIETPAHALDLLQPAWDLLLENFGPSRLMWGSDWPVLTLAADYGRWVQLSERLIDALGASERRRVWHDTAAETYRLGHGESNPA